MSKGFALLPKRLKNGKTVWLEIYDTEDLFENFSNKQKSYIKDKKAKDKYDVSFGK